MSYGYGDKANEFLTIDDARQFGHTCRCGSRKVVYHITIAAPGFPQGHYCLRCLANLCKAAHRVPVPMDDNLFDALKYEISGANKILIVRP